MLSIDISAVFQYNLYEGMLSRDIERKSIYMNILVVGGGGREHAILHKLSQSERVGKLFAAPGNGGIASIATCLDIAAVDIDKIVEAARDYEIDIVFVAPDDPLMLGLVDRLNEAGVRTFGPRQNAAIIEGSKVFAKELMKKYSIPTAQYEVFESYDAACEYVKRVNKYPTVIKAEGLALGKGVIIAKDYDEAKAALSSIMCSRVFGEAGDRVVIEEFLSGREVSVLAFTDGKTVIPMVSAQDHKRALDNDRGLNTGGMGAFSPSDAYTDEIADYCMKKIYLPTIRAMESEGRSFCGVLYFGLIITDNGVFVIEYNARFGDPEAQVVLPRLRTDLLDIMEAVESGTLDRIQIEWSEQSAVCVVAASGGYPSEYKAGYEITGLPKLPKLLSGGGDVFAYHAGTKQKSGRIVTSGGRVLGITALSDTLDSAAKRAYDALSKINFENMHYRNDIGIRKK